MQLGEKIVALRNILVSDYKIAEADAINIARHAENITRQELAQTEAVLNAFEGHVQLHPFVYICLATIAGSALGITLMLAFRAF